MLANKLSDTWPACTDQWFNYKDCQIAVSEYNPPAEAHGTALFIHGRLGNSQIWKTVIQDLSRHFRCVCLDLPGSGRSFSVRGEGLSLIESADMIHQLSQQLGLGSALVVGHDLGAAVGQLFGLHHASRVRAFALINPVSLCTELARVPRGLFGKLRLARVFRDSEILGTGEDVSYLFRASGLRSIEESWPPDSERQSIRRAMTHLEHPTLLLWGARDPLNPVERGFELMRQLPEAYLFENEFCGHWPCIENPAWVTAKIREFLFRVVAGRRHVRRTRIQR